MKFMAATGLFAVTTACLMQVADVRPQALPSFYWIAVLIVSTSLFEVAYISLQGSLGEASHYNTSDLLHAVMSGLMGIVAVALTASQAWLAWVIWSQNAQPTLSVMQSGIVVGLIMTFVLSTLSGFLLGSHQAPPGKGLPIVGWHLRGDIRPAHFLGVHAQQFIPVFGFLAEYFAGGAALAVFSTLTMIYLLVCICLTLTATRAIPVTSHFG
ncbi:hypothetical protein [Undibacterium sp. Ji49W]|uniref:hypothetical protein n=1 Tax=Undibacterium sp. Ji49W TaxID=3413040 RepID=UPI003BF37A5D